MNNRTVLFGGKSTGGIAFTGTLAACSLVLGWIEFIMPISSVPGIKLGISNIVIVIALYNLSKTSACFLSIIKPLLSCFLFSGASALPFSLSGSLLSFAAMMLVYKRKSVSEIGASALGGAMHITAQVLAAIILTGTPSLWRLLPVLWLCGIITGTLIGVVSKIIGKRIVGIRKF